MQRSSRCCSRSEAGMPASTSGQGHRLALSTVRLHPCRARDSFQACKAQARLNLLYTMANVDPSLALLLLSCLSCHPAPFQARPLFQATYLVPRPLAAAACCVQMRALSPLHEPSRCTATTQGALPGGPPPVPTMPTLHALSPFQRFSRCAVECRILPPSRCTLLDLCLCILHWPVPCATPGLLPALRGAR